MLRENDPVHWSEEFRCWILTRHSDVLGGLRSANLVTEHHLRSSRQIFGRTALDVDGPAHRDFRRMVTWFRREDVADYRPWVDEAVEGVLDDLQPDSPVDLVAAVAHRIPARVIGKVLGLSAGAGEELYGSLGPVFAHIDDPRSSVMTALDAYDGVLAALADMEFSSHGIAEALRRGDRQRQVPSADDAGRQVALMLAAGTRTTTAAIANTLAAVSGNPDAYQRLGEPGWRSAVVAESLRWRPPLHFTLRFAATDCQLGEQAVPAGAPVQLALAAANHDAQVFPDPEAWVPTRDTGQTLAFGGGRHVCAGSLLATAEIERLLAAVHRRFRRLVMESPPVDAGLTFVMPSELSVTAIAR